MNTDALQDYGLSIPKFVSLHYILWTGVWTGSGRGKTKGGGPKVDPRLRRQAEMQLAAVVCA